MSESRLFLLLLQLSAIAAAAGAATCKDGVRVDDDGDVTAPPPVDCDKLVWTDNNTLAQTFVQPEETEFVVGGGFNIECKVCTNPDYLAVVLDIEWSRQGGPLPSLARVSELDVNSRPALTILRFASAQKDDGGVYKCKPKVALNIPGDPAPPTDNSTGNSNGNSSDNATEGPPVIIRPPSQVVDKGDYSGYSTVTLAVACAGDDPRFSIPLSDGKMLCFTVDGKAGDIFNLISDEHLSVNVRYKGGTDGFSVWMDEVAVVLNSGCRIRVESKPEAVLVDNVQVRGHFSDQNVTVDVIRGDYVAIKIRSPNVQLRVEFIDEHLSFYIVDGKGFSPQVHGLLGQFWNSNHKIEAGRDQRYGILRRNKRAAAVLMKQKRWPFMHGHKDATCWAVHGKHPQGAVDWTHSTYKMKTLCQSKTRILKRLHP